MSRCRASLRCGALAGLALLFAAPLNADEALRDAVRKQLRDESYILVEDDHGPRLYVLSGDSRVDDFMPTRDAAPSVTDRALAMTRSADAKTRVRGLTLLATETSSEARDAALALLSDPAVAVREEAYQLLMEHPHAGVDSIVALARQDRSTRVREVVEELLAEQAGD